MNEDTKIILEELKGMRSDISELKNDVSELKNDMTAVKLKLENEIQPAIRIIGENHISLHEKIDYLMEEKKSTQFQIDMLKMRVSNLEAKMV